MSEGINFANYISDIQESYAKEENSGDFYTPTPTPTPAQSARPVKRVGRAVVSPTAPRLAEKRTIVAKGVIPKGWGTYISLGFTIATAVASLVGVDIPATNAIQGNEVTVILTALTGAYFRRAIK